jgi:hypothetical protein
MQLPVLILWLLSIGVVIGVQVWYARKGYSQGLRAKQILFFSGFLCGAFGAWFVFSGLSVVWLSIAIIILGILTGTYSAYIFPGKMEIWIPRKTNS